MMKKSAAIRIGLLLGLLVFSLSTQAEQIGFWAFEEGSGSTVSDLTGHGLNGTIFNVNKGLGTGGSVWATDAQRGSVISFGGTASGAYVFIGDNVIPVLTFTTDFTWAFWTKQATGFAENNIIVGNRMKSDSTDFNPREFQKFTPTKAEIHTNAAGADNLDYEDIPIDVWVHHVFVKKGKELIYYRNGVQAGTQPFTTEFKFSLPLYFGGDNEGAAGENWVGYLDNVHIFNAALSADSAAALYNWELANPSNCTDWELLK